MVSLDDFPLFKIGISEGLECKAGINKVNVKKAAEMFIGKVLEKDPEPELNQKYQFTEEVDGVKIFGTGEFMNDRIFFVKNAKRAR